MSCLVPGYLVSLCLILANIGSDAVGPLENYDLIQSNLIYRHGDRSPVATYKNDPNIDKWPQGLGQLTQRGMKMHYSLGQYLRTRYMDSGFLNSTYYSRNDVYVRSTDKDRTLMSADCDLAGLFPPNDSQKWNENIDWQPIPVHTIAIENEELLDPMNICPKFDQLQLETEKTPAYLGIEEKYKHVIEVTANETEVDPYLVDIEFTIDNLFCCTEHNLSLPDWATEEGFMKNLTTIGIYRIASYFNSKEKSRLTGGNILGEIKDNMLNASTGAVTKKLFIYSAHDTTIAAYLSTLLMYNQMWPPYASCVLTELYMDTNNSDFFVQVSFRNDTSVKPYVLEHPNCSYLCPLEKFVELAAPYIPINRKKECQISKPIKPMSMRAIEILAGVGGTVVFIVLLVIVFKACRSDSRSHWYSRMGHQSETA